MNYTIKFVEPVADIKIRSGHCCVKVDISFTAVGMIDIPDEKEISEIISKIQENPKMYKVG